MSLYASKASVEKKDSTLCYSLFSILFEVTIDLHINSLISVSLHHNIESDRGTFFHVNIHKINIVVSINFNLKDSAGLSALFWKCKVSSQVVCVNEIHDTSLPGSVSGLFKSHM